MADRPPRRRRPRRPRLSAVDREIGRLAVPAFGALVAEPLFLLVDSAVVGRLGTVPLAGLGVAAAVLATVVGLCVFLAYGTTASVARRLGAGDLPGALARGVDGLWLAVLVGVALGLAGVVAAPGLVAALGATAEVQEPAVAYLRVSCLGLPAMLLVLAATGVLRGLQDTRTPLVVAVVGAVVNAALSAWFVLGLGLGVAGSAWATVLVQVGMSVAYLAVVVPGLRRSDVPLAPRRRGLLTAARAGAHLLLRTVTLRAVLLAAAVVATRLGTREVAAHQVVLNVFLLLSLALDAVAIAAQALVGRDLGAGDEAQVRATTGRTVRWGVVTGLAAGLLLLAVHRLVPPLFGDDPRLQDLIAATLVVLALSAPLAGVVFVLDGVLIGAGDAAFLARAHALVLAVFLPAAVAVLLLGGGLVALWAVLGVVFLGGRAVLLVRRTRSGAWIVLGAGT